MRGRSSVIRLPGEFISWPAERKVIASFVDASSPPAMSRSPCLMFCSLGVGSAALNRTGLESHRNARECQVQLERLVHCTSLLALHKGLVNARVFASNRAPRDDFCLC